MNFQEQIEKLNDCAYDLTWIGTKTLEQTISDCEYLECLLWLLVRYDPKIVVGLACQFARKTVSIDLQSIELVEAWLRGDVSGKDVEAAYLEDYKSDNILYVASRAVYLTKEILDPDAIWDPSNSNASTTAAYLAAVVAEFAWTDDVEAEYLLLAKEAVPIEDLKKWLEQI